MGKRVHSDGGLRRTYPAAPHLALGRAGEDAACALLAESGLRICDRNWRPEGMRHSLELDVVAVDGDLVIFVEVKTRTGAKTGEGIPAYAAFTPAKRRNMVRAAQAYLNEKELWERPCRFDLIAVERLPDGRLVLEHVSDVIEFGRTLGSGHTAWQPW